MGSAFNKDLLHQTSFVSILARRQNHWNNIDICKTSLVSVDRALAEVLRGEGNGTHCSPLAWKIPWMEEPGRLQCMGLLGIGQD